MAGDRRGPLRWAVVVKSLYDEFACLCGVIAADRQRQALISPPPHGFKDYPVFVYRLGSARGADTDLTSGAVRSHVVPC